MTKQADVASAENTKLILDHGFVRLVDYMGSDAAVVQAARTSYGDGTKTVTEDTALVRYLMRHQHTSPFEMCQVKLHIKIPIFVMRQLVRHRTASLNEYSGRYSVMTDEFYLPEPDMIKPQSLTNNQGRAGIISNKDIEGARWMINAASEQAYETYEALLASTENKDDVIYDAYSTDDPLFSNDFQGIARELARTVLPVSNYTELYWSQNLRNLLHLLKLRLDEHAQEEIRILAQAIYELIEPLFPESVRAFDDYVRLATSLSRMETDLITILMESDTSPKAKYRELLSIAGSDKQFAADFGMSLRELKDFAKKWKMPLWADLEAEIETSAP